jgi:hypothetical protein
VSNASVDVGHWPRSNFGTTCTLAPQTPAEALSSVRHRNVGKAKLSDETGFDYFRILDCDLVIGSSPVDDSAARAWG